MDMATVAELVGEADESAAPCRSYPIDILFKKAIELCKPGARSRNWMPDTGIADSASLVL